MNENWIERQSVTPEARRRYEQERLVLWATDKISEAMDERNVSKAELARRLGTSRPYVTGLLGGGRNMTLRTLADVACVLGQRVDVSMEPLREGRYMSAPVRVVRNLRTQVVAQPVERSAADAHRPGEAAGAAEQTLAA